MLVAFALVYNLSYGIFENRSMHARNYTSLPCPYNIGPPKSIWISLFGSTQGLIGDHFLFGIILLRFLPNSVQGRHVLALFIKSLLMKGHHSLVPSSVIPHEPGWVAWRTSMTTSFFVLGIVRRLSRSMQPSFTLSWFQCTCICLLTALHWRSSFWIMQSQISLRTLSLFVIAAISVELNTSLIALSSVMFAVEDVFVSSLFGLRYVEKKNWAFCRTVWGSICASCSSCISKVFCFCVSNWLLFVLVGKCDFAIACCVILCSNRSFFVTRFYLILDWFVVCVGCNYAVFELFLYLSSDFVLQALWFWSRPAIARVIFWGALLGVWLPALCLLIWNRRAIPI